jgi:hypothetical protein
MWIGKIKFLENLSRVFLWEGDPREEEKNYALHS